jgi:hypothetical protein
MDQEVPGVFRPTGGTKKFRRNCRLVAEDGSIAVTDREGTTTRFPLDNSDEAPKEMMSYLHKNLFIILDGNGRGIVKGNYLVWDAAENAQFCAKARIENSVTNTYAPAPLRPDAILLEEPAWLRRYVSTAPYVMAAGVALAAVGRALNLPVWLMLPFLPWLLLYPVARGTGYFAPQRVSADEIAYEKEIAEYAEKQARKGRKSKPTNER